MNDKTKISEIIKYLDKNGFYKLEKDKNGRDIYTKVINYFMTKTTVSYKSNILQIKNIVGRNNEFIADIKYSNPKKKGVKKTCLDLRDKKILALLKDYEYMLKGSLKYLEDVYSKLYEMGISEVDYSKPLEEVNLEELVQFIKEGGVEKKNEEEDELKKDEEKDIEEYKEKQINNEDDEYKEKVYNGDDEEYIEDNEEFKETIFNDDDEYIEDYQLVDDEDEEEIEKVDDLGVSEEIYIEDDFKSDQNLEEDEINTPDNSEKLLDTNEEKEDINKEEDSKPKKFKVSERESTPILSSVEKESSKSNEKLKIGQKQKKINFANLLIYSRFD